MRAAGLLFLALVVVTLVVVIAKKSISLDTSVAVREPNMQDAAEQSGGFAAENAAPQDFYRLPGVE